MNEREKNQLEEAHAKLYAAQLALANAVIANLEYGGEPSRRPQAMEIAIQIYHLTDKVWGMFEAVEDELEREEEILKKIADADKCPPPQTK